MTLRIALVLLLGLWQAGCSTTSWQDPRNVHIVRRGETLFSIAWRYGKSTQDIARWNRLGDGSLIFPGQKLKLTGPAAVASRTRNTTTTPQTTPRATRKAPTRSLPAIPSQPAPPWKWPSAGRINVGFGAKPGTGTGVLIDGKTGQGVHAAASGKVVYAGNGLSGYGNLVIIKHNETYLSAYGYNAKLLVKESDSVRQGQRIATMGEGPERKPRLHFEVRRNGEPIDPGKLLPRR